MPRVTNGELAARLDGIHQDVQTLLKVVVTGNGTPPLMSRVTALETTQRLTAKQKGALAVGSLGGVVGIVHAVMRALA